MIKATALLLTLFLNGGNHFPPWQDSKPQTPVTENKPAGRAKLKWRAKNLDGVYGFLIYRAETREGPFLRVNPAVVKVSDARDGAFIFEDTGLTPGKTYYYYLDTLSTGGIKKRFSGVMSKTIETQ